MITHHTAQSLGKYIGQKVLVKMSPDFIGTLSTIRLHLSPWANTFEIIDDKIIGYSCVTPENIYPLLKDYTQLLVPMMHEGIEILPIEWVYGWDEKSKINLKANGIEYEKYENIFEIVFDDFINTVKNDLFVFDRIQKLQDLGFGAIKCEESPTGYRDLWNNPCKLDEGK